MMLLVDIPSKYDNQVQVLSIVVLARPLVQLTNGSTSYFNHHCNRKRRSYANTATISAAEADHQGTTVLR
jgi:hypothetical protein